MFKQRSSAIWGMLVITALILVAVSPVALAQDWSFNVAENVVHLYLEKDGTARIVYDITFVNDPGAPAITGIDVGMPNSTYVLS